MEGKKKQCITFHHTWSKPEPLLLLALRNFAKTPGVNHCSGLLPHPSLGLGLWPSRSPQGCCTGQFLCPLVFVLPLQLSSPQGIPDP